MMLQGEFHIPVFLNRVIRSLNISRGKKYIDATVGGAGYAIEILKLGGLVLGIDLDQDALDHIKKFRINKNIYLRQGNFRDIKKIAIEEGFAKADGIIFDLGMSTYQLEHSGRGFSFRRDEPLDMRLDQTASFKAVDLINNYSKEKLYEIFTKYSEELNSGAIADAVVRARSLTGPITTTRQLALIIENALTGSKLREGDKNFDSAKTLARIFQSIRVEVNNELDNLRTGLEDAIGLLNHRGRIVAISYHSLEDRIVKLTFGHYRQKRIIKLITKKPITCSREEKSLNPKSGSAKLRIAEKI